MTKSSVKKLNLILITILLAAIFPLSVTAAGDDVIMNYYENNRAQAAALAIAMIDSQNTGLYYLGDIENDPDFVFAWASCTKVITWVCVMQMVEKGKIDLTADIKTYLPENFLTLKYSEPITMLNLMNHNAGFQEMDDVSVENKAELKPLGDALRFYQPPQIRKPGEIVAYSNYGTGLAGYIVECVSGYDYGDYVRNNIFAPLEMEHTSIRPDFSDNSWVAKQREGEVCYLIAEDGEKTELGRSLEYVTTYPAGAACGTIDDFAKFVRALIPDENNKCPLFEQDITLSEMYKPTLYYADGKTARFAHGMLTGQFGNTLFGHGGNLVGFSSNFMIDPISQKAYAVMTNVGGELTFNHKALPVIFGDYNWEVAGTTDSSDISGRYFFMRGYYPHSFKKFGNSAVTGANMTIKKHEGNYIVTWPWAEGDYAPNWISDKAFLVDDGFMPMVFFVRDDGVLQSGEMDWRPMSSVGYYAEWVLFILLVLSGVFSITVLITKGAILIVKYLGKKELNKLPAEKSHFISLCLVVATLLLIYLMTAVTLLSDAPDDFLKAIVFGLIATVCSIAAFVFGFLQVKTRITGSRTKSLRVITLISSAIVLANVFYWELFNFWSI